jgi:hypothetical protein
LLRLARREDDGLGYDGVGCDFMIPMGPGFLVYSALDLAFVGIGILEKGVGEMSVHVMSYRE